MKGIEKSLLYSLLLPFMSHTNCIVRRVYAVHPKAYANADIPSQLIESWEPALCAVVGPDVRCWWEHAILETFPHAICCGRPYAGPKLQNDPAPKIAVTLWTFKGVTKRFDSNLSKSAKIKPFSFYLKKTAGFTSTSHEPSFNLDVNQNRNEMELLPCYYLYN